MIMASTGKAWQKLLVVVQWSTSPGRTTRYSSSISHIYFIETWLPFPTDTHQVHVTWASMMKRTSGLSFLVLRSLLPLSTDVMHLHSLSSKLPYLTMFQISQPAPSPSHSHPITFVYCLSIHFSQNQTQTSNLISDAFTILQSTHPRPRLLQQRELGHHPPQPVPETEIPKLLRTLHGSCAHGRE